MKKLTKLLCFLLITIFTFSFVGCKDSADGLEVKDITTGIKQGQTSQAVHIKDKATTAGRVTLEKDSDCPADFTLNVSGNEPIKILQITDTQMIDPTQVNVGFSIDYSNPDYCLYDIVDDVIEQTNPDLILITGDYVYGDYDHNGTLFRQQTDYFDSKGIFWAPLFGNHDGDSESDYALWLDPEYPDWYTRKQTEYFEKSPYCLFRARVDVSGFSNYSIVVKQNGQVKRSIFMLDTKGYWKLTQEITPAQLDWYKQSVNAINTYANAKIPQFVGIHVPLYAFNLAAQQYGYVEGDTAPNIEVPINSKGDYMYLHEGLGKMDSNNVAFNTFKNNGTDAILAGHLHSNSASILYQGVRLIFGLKSSRYAGNHPGLLGGTLITGIDGNFTVAPIYYQG